MKNDNNNASFVYSVNLLRLLLGMELNRLSFLERCGIINREIDTEVRM